MFMAICDNCNSTTSWEEGTSYTATEFREVVSKGFEPAENIIGMMISSLGLSREQAIAHWKQGLVAGSTTGWLLCPSCAAMAAKYLPKPSGTGPVGQLEETFFAFTQQKKKWWQFWK